MRINQRSEMIAAGRPTVLSRRVLICSLAVLTLGARTSVSCVSVDALAPGDTDIVIVQGWILSASDLA